MATVRLPTMNAAPIMQGLEALGNAFEHQRQIQIQRETADATLRVNQKINDKINELSNSKDFSKPGVDWGASFRDITAEIVNSESSNFSDSGAFQDFANNVQMNAEQNVNGYRALQLKKQKEENAASFAASNDAALAGAADNLAGTIAAINTKWGAQPGTNQDGSPNVRFNDAALDAEGGPQPALAKYQGLHDQAASAWLDARVRAIEGDATKNAQQKAYTLELLSKNFEDQLKGQGATVSSGFKTKAQAAFDDKLALAKKAGEAEKTSADVGRVVSATLAASLAASRAVESGGHFSPTEFKPYKELLLDPQLDTKAKDALANDIRIFTTAQKQGITPAQIEAADKEAINTINAKLADLANRGVDRDGLKNEAFRLAEKATSTVKAATAKYADGLDGLDKNASLKSALAIITAGTTDATRAGVIREFLAEAGGASQWSGEKSIYRDPGTGQFLIEKVNALATKLVDSKQVEATKRLLSPRQSNATEGEACDYLSAAHSGQFAGRFSVETESKAAVFASTIKTSLLKQGNVKLADGSPYYDRYGESGVPMWRDVDGGWWRPRVDSGKTIVWDYIPDDGKSTRGNIR